MICPRCNSGLVDEQWRAGGGAGGPYRGAVFAARSRRCPDCRGGWLPYGDLTTMLTRCVPGVRMATIDEGWRDDQEPMEVADNLRLGCPRCGEPMEKLRSKLNILIIYDRCRTCHGLWFDEGEIERLARAIAIPAVLRD